MTRSQYSWPLNIYSSNGDDFSTALCLQILKCYVILWIDYRMHMSTRQHWVLCIELSSVYLKMLQVWAKIRCNHVCKSNFTVHLPYTGSIRTTPIYHTMYSEYKGQVRPQQAQKSRALPWASKSWVGTLEIFYDKVRIRNLTKLNCSVSILLRSHWNHASATPRHTSSLITFFQRANPSETSCLKSKHSVKTEEFFIHML